MNFVNSFRNRYPCPVSGCEYKAKTEAELCYKHYLKAKSDRESSKNVNSILDAEELTRLNKKDYHERFSQK